jgi:hypothetical protein
MLVLLLELEGVAEVEPEDNDAAPVTDKVPPIEALPVVVTAVNA